MQRPTPILNSPGKTLARLLLLPVLGSWYTERQRGHELPPNRTKTDKPPTGAEKMSGHIQNGHPSMVIANAAPRMALRRRYPLSSSPTAPTICLRRRFGHFSNSQGLTIATDKSARTDGYAASAAIAAAGRSIGAMAPASRLLVDHKQSEPATTATHSPRGGPFP